MTPLALPLPPLDLGRPAAEALDGRIAGAATRVQAQRLGEEFERMFIAQMLAPMFADLGADAPFHGGASEEAFRPMLLEHYAKAVGAGGGVGVADAVTREILKLQGLE